MRDGLPDADHGNAKVWLGDSNVDFRFLEIGMP